MEYLNLIDFQPAKYINNRFELQIKPFEYLDGRKPRLPRKSSKHYNLKADYKFFFQNAFSEIKTQATPNKFEVEISVNCGKDRLGTADLDNYCKAILDGVTFTQKVWIDDRQVDQILIKRNYTNELTSTIDLKIYVIS